MTEHPIWWVLAQGRCQADQAVQPSAKGLFLLGFFVTHRGRPSGRGGVTRTDYRTVSDEFRTRRLGRASLYAAGSDQLATALVERPRSRPEEAATGR